MLRKILVVLSTMFFVASQARALGLGEFQLESSVNQPLRGHVEILQLGDVELDELNIGLASAEDYQRFNIDRPQFLSEIEFQIQQRGNIPVLVFSSTQPVREPYLNLIVDTRWPHGRLLTEYTVLLDLPVFSQSTSVQAPRQPVSATAETPARPSAATASQSASPAADDSGRGGGIARLAQNAEPSTEAIEQNAPGDEAEPANRPEQQAEQSARDEAAEPGTLRTNNADTLWDIALRVRPDDSVSVQQTMLAIQRLNPRAFIGGNINRLRYGEILRIPSLRDIRTVGQREAIAEVARQNQSLGMEPLAAPVSQAPVRGGRQGQLSVVTAEDTDTGASGSGGALEEENTALDARVAELENLLAVEREESDRLRLEREEMESRLTDLATQIASAQELITLQDQRLAQLQESLAQQAAEAEAAAQAAQMAAAQTQAAVRNQGGFLDSVMVVLANSGALLAGALAAVVGLLVLLLLRRNRAADKVFDEEVDAMAGNELADAAVADAGPTAAAPAPRPAPRGTDLDQDMLDSELSDIINLSEEFEDLNQEEPHPEQARRTSAEEPPSDTPMEDLDFDFDESTDDSPSADSEFDFADDVIDLQDQETGDEEEAAGYGLDEEHAADRGTGFELDTDEADQDTAAVDDLEILDFDDLTDDAETRDTAPAVPNPPEEETPELETFSFDLDLESGAEEPAAATEASTLENEKEEEQDEELEAFDFDLDSDSGDTAMETREKADSREGESALVGTGPAEDEGADGVEEDFDFDLDLDLEAEQPGAGTEVEADPGIDPEESESGSDAEAPEAPDEDDDIDFVIEDEAATDREPPVDNARRADTGASGQVVSEEQLGSMQFSAEDAAALLDEEDFDLLSDEDEAATRLDLAYAYKKMGDAEGAREILEQVIRDGNEQQVSEARELLASLDRPSED